MRQALHRFGSTARSLLIGLASSMIVLILFPIINVAIEWLPVALFFNLRGSQPAHGDISVCAIEDKNFDRDDILDLIHGLACGGASVIALDIEFVAGRDIPEETDKFFTAIKEFKPVIVGFKFHDQIFAGSSRRAPPRLPGAAIDVGGRTWPGFKSMVSVAVHDKLIESDKPLIESDKQLKPLKPMGFINAPHLWFVHHAWLVVKFNDWYYPSLPLTAVRVYHEAESLKLESSDKGKPILKFMNWPDPPSVKEPKLLELEIPTDLKGRLRINYRGLEKTIPTFSAHDVVHKRLDPQTFAGDIVFVGYTRHDRDRYMSPFFDWKSGVEIHATIADNILSSDYIRDRSRDPWVSFFTVLALGLLTSIITPRLAKKKYLALLVMLPWFSICFCLFALSEILISITAPAISGVLSFVLSLYFLEEQGVDIIESTARKIEEKDGLLQEKDVVLKRKSVELKKKDGEIACRDEKIQNKDERIEKQDAALRNKHKEIERMGEEIKTLTKECTILFLAANPAGIHQLRLDDEIREIEVKIRAADYCDTLELISKWAVRPTDLQQALLQHHPHVVHFSGHGNPAGEIILKGSDGKPKPVGKNALKGLFTALKDNIRLVVINACYSKHQAEAIVEAIDCVVGMKAMVSDEAAIAFAAAFYRAIGFGLSVQNAFELGRNELLLNGIAGEDIPELLSREGVDASQIFLVQKTD